MPGPRLRAHSQANPISATLLSPLNARSTNHHSLPRCALVTPVRPPVFANNWPSSFTNATRRCSRWCRSKKTHPRPGPHPSVGLVAAAGSLPSSLSSRKSSRTTTTTTRDTTCDSTFCSSLQGRSAVVGRITHDCIETTSAASSTNTFTCTTPTASAKANPAVRATIVAVVAAAVAASSLACLLHFFVRGSTLLAANLIVLLHDSNLRCRFLTSHSPSTSPPSPSPAHFQIFPSLPSPSLPSSREGLAISTSVAQASLQTPLRPDPYSTVPHASANTRLPTLLQQPAYPGASPDLDRSVAAAGLPQGRSPSFLRGYDPKDYFTQSPFRNRAASSAARRLPHLSAARLWNPTNSTPRLPEKTIRKRRPSTPPPPAVPLSHPTLDPYSVDPSDPLGIGAGDYPLLTLPEQRQTRHSTSNRASLQLDRNAEHRISLPPSVRHSYDGRRSADPSPTFQDPDSGLGDDKGDAPAEPPVEPRVTGLRKRGQSVSNPLVVDFAYVDKGKGKAIMEQTTEAQVRGTSKDLERGPDVLPRISNVSAGDGIGSAISSSNSSIMGEELPPDLGEEWGPQHPCFPHLNPHVPIDSPEYHNTRIIRIRRDWLLEGDLAPTFSNLYPEILDPAGLSEQEFRRIIDRLNGELVPIFSPYNWRNILDSVLGLVTGWLWDDLGFTGVKARLKRLERWVDQWNNEMEKTVGNEDPSMAPRIISLRRTGYMTLDIQIPDPEIAPAPSTPTGSGNMPMEPPAAVTA
ncbi:hypothetical protein GQ607_005201 [Colletotrichum asianum]|uniref:Ras modification protein ERF4 n=1 Tax=Colletotrichum asianum TaxID=702518 RepID=A0A8H3WKU4_9PEZI|nr:hypothetical protein GQ607_005201 [Colletotrichum asianum]